MLNYLMFLIIIDYDSLSRAMDTIAEMYGKQMTLAEFTALYGYILEIERNLCLYMKKEVAHKIIVRELKNLSDILDELDGRD